MRDAITDTDLTLDCRPYGLRKATGRESMPVRVHHENVRYLRTKRDRMGHLLEELDQIAEGQL